MSVADLVHFVGVLIQALAFAIFARAIISWFPINPNGPIVQALDAVTEPVLQPLRRIIPRIGMIDLTPLVAMIALTYIGQQVSSY